MTTGPLALCFSCKRLRITADNPSGTWPYCEAFPGDPPGEGPGIPVEIASWQHDHHKPFPGDHGLTYLEIHPAEPGDTPDVTEL
jgi:hypothetical protein